MSYSRRAPTLGTRRYWSAPHGFGLFGRLGVASLIDSADFAARTPMLLLLPAVVSVLFYFIFFFLSYCCATAVVRTYRPVKYARTTRFSEFRRRRLDNESHLDGFAANAAATPSTRHSCDNYRGGTPVSVRHRAAVQALYTTPRCSYLRYRSRMF